MLVLRFLLAMLPIIWLMIALSVLKMPGFKACGIAAVIAALIIAYFFLKAFTMNTDFSNFQIYGFPRYSFVPVVFLAAAVGVLWRKPLQTLFSVLLGAAFAYIYLLLPFHIPYL